MKILANSKWQGRIVIRQSNNIYNQSLVASLIFNNGKEETSKWAKGLLIICLEHPKETIGLRF